MGGLTRVWQTSAVLHDAVHQLVCDLGRITRTRRPERTNEGTTHSSHPARAFHATCSVVPPNVLGVSCTAGPACQIRSGAAPATNDVRSAESRPATGVTPSRSRRRRQLGCRAEAHMH
jgi:hypothetical protein